MVRLIRPAAVAAAVFATCTGVRAADLSPQTTFINEQIAAKYKEAEIKKPAARATDAEFLRRVFIDILGRVATPEEFADFEADKGADKRVRLVRRLLTTDQDARYKPRLLGVPAKRDGKPVEFDYADEYARHWSNVWTVWLMSRSVHEVYREQMQVWLQTEIMKGTNYRDMVTQVLTATGKTNANGAVNFVAQQLGETVPPDRREELGTYDAVPVTSRVTRLFLGLQTQCTQCHDHPFNKEWVQADFWGVNAFFRQVERSGMPTRPAQANQMMMELQQLEVSDKSSVNADGRIFYERRDGQLKSIKPTFLKDMAQAEKGEKSDKVPAAEGKSRRESLAQFVVGHDNFSRAYVNRMWGHLFGRGLNKDATIDDFGSHNEVVHPELLNRLADEFVKYGYDPKKLLEWICTSDAYSLSHVANKDYADPKFDPYFARMPLKALSPEVLFESISVATKADSAKNSDVKARKDARERWLGKLVLQFGDDEGNEMTFNGTVVQALLMMNGRELNEEIGSRGANAVARVAEKHTKAGVTNADAVLDELFVMTLNRHATPEEKSKLKGLMVNGAVIAGREAQGRGRHASDARQGGQQGHGEGAETAGDCGRRGPHRVVGCVVLPGRVLGATQHQRVHVESLGVSIAVNPSKAHRRTSVGFSHARTYTVRPFQSGFFSTGSASVKAPSAVSRAKQRAYISSLASRSSMWCRINTSGIAGSRAEPQAGVLRWLKMTCSSSSSSSGFNSGTARAASRTKSRPRMTWPCRWPGTVTVGGWPTPPGVSSATRPMSCNIAPATTRSRLSGGRNSGYTSR